MEKTVFYEEAADAVLSKCISGVHFCDHMTTPSCREITIESVDERLFCITWMGGGEPPRYVLVDCDGLRELLTHWASVKLLYNRVYSWYKVELKKTAKLIGFNHPKKLDGMDVNFS